VGKIQKVYTREWKEEAVRLAATSGKPVAQVAELSWVFLIARLTGGAVNWPNMEKRHFQAKGIKQFWKKRIVVSNAKTRFCGRSVRYKKKP